MKLLSEDILVLVVEREGEPIAVIQQESIDKDEDVSIHCLYNNELARKNIKQYLKKYPIKKEL